MSTTPRTPSASSGHVALSYSHLDREVAGELVRVIEAAGWQVWWDPNINPGSEFDRSIEENFRASACIVMLWSKGADASRWVRSEADLAAKLGKLLPVLIDGTELPLSVRTVQGVLLTDWNGRDDHAGVIALLESIPRIAAAPPPITGRAPVPRWLRRLLAVAPLALLVALYYVPKQANVLRLRAAVDEFQVTVAQSTETANRFIPEPFVLDTLTLSGVRGYRLLWPGESEPVEYTSRQFSVRVPADGDATAASVTLAVDPLPVGTTARFVRLDGDPSQTIIASGPLDTLTVTLLGPLEVRDRENGSRRADFSSPTPLTVLLGRSELTLTMRGVNDVQRKVGPLPVSQLRFTRRNNNGVAESTVHGGVIAFPEFSAREDSISSANLLSLDSLAGRFTADIDARAVEVVFEGSVPVGIPSTIRRSWLDYLWHSQFPALVGGLLVYLAAALGLGPLLTRRRT